MKRKLRSTPIIDGNEPRGGNESTFVEGEHDGGTLDIQQSIDLCATPKKRGIDLNTMLEQKQKRVCRMKNPMSCNGGCGIDGCNAICDGKTELANHQRKNFVCCPFCPARPAERKGNLYAHVRRSHPEKLDKDGGCSEIGMKPKRAAVIRCPERFNSDSRVWTMLTGGGYNHLIKMVKSHIQKDVAKAKRRWPEQECYLRVLAATGNASNKMIHAICHDILDALVDGDMLWGPVFDGAGGFLPNGFDLRPHGGLYNLSLDRIDQSEPHITKGHVLNNLRFVAAAVNTSAGLVDTHGTETCAFLRKEMARVVDPAAVESLICGEQMSMTCGELNIAYMCCNHIINKKLNGVYSDPLCRAEFASSAKFFQHGLKLLSQQQGLCAISGIMLRGRDGESWFGMSLDAINPRLGHVSGNIRWVCRFLNNINRDKDKTHDSQCDGESWWTAESFRAYVGFGLKTSTVTDI